MYTDKYRAYIWTSLGEFRYERHKSVYITLLMNKRYIIPIL